MTWIAGERKASTVHRIRTSFVSLQQYFGNRAVQSITVGDLDDFKSYRRTAHRVTDVTIRHDLHALSQFFRYAIRHRWCQSNPVESAEIPSGACNRYYVVSYAEEAAYFAAALKVSQALYDLGRLMILQGCRPGELHSLAKADVNLETSHLTIREGKTKAARRTLLLQHESREILARRMSSDGPWVFPGRRKGEHVTKFNTLHDQVCEATGLQFRMYDFRHTFATRALQADVNIARLAAILGHADLKMILQYGHMKGSDIDAGMRQIAAAADSTPGRGPKGDQNTASPTFRDETKGDHGAR